MRAQQHLPWMDFYANRSFAFVIKSYIMQNLLGCCRPGAAQRTQPENLLLPPAPWQLRRAGSGGASPLPAQLHLQRRVQGAAPAAHHTSQCLKLQLNTPSSFCTSAASPQVATHSTKAAPWARRAQPRCPQTHRAAAQEAGHAALLVIWLVLQLPKVSSHLVLLSF